MSSITTISDEKVKSLLKDRRLTSETSTTVSKKRETKAKLEIEKPFSFRGKEVILHRRRSEVCPRTVRALTDEQFQEYDSLDGMSISSDLILSKPDAKKITELLAPSSSMHFISSPTAASSTISRDVSVQSSAISFIPNRLPIDFDRRFLIDPQAQGDFGIFTEGIRSESLTSINVSINFALYAKLLAFLLTINTLIFFKTVVFAAIWKILEVYAKI